VSRFPVLETASICYPKNCQYRPNQEVEPLSFLKARVKTPQGEMNVIVTHLDCYDDSGETRRLQVEYLMQHIENDEPSLPVIVMGDFNALNGNQLALDPDNKTRIEHQDRARNVLTPLHELTPIYHSKLSEIFDSTDQLAPRSTVWSDRKVDHMFVSSNLEVAQSTVFLSCLSDHYGIIGDLSMRKR